MLNFSPEKLFLVGVIALIVLGPHRLPHAARSAGRFVAQLRRMSASFQQEVREALADPADAVNSTVGEFRVPDLRRSVREAVTSTFSAPVTAVPETPAAPPGPSVSAGPPIPTGSPISAGSSFPTGSSALVGSSGPAGASVAGNGSHPVAPDDPSLN
ncbi:MAG TPA: twin-arginine translocase TatA/TatE family subunit [Acidimicrobiales bacterium]|nr:twin-arginine translocase TatA/TatE family subunit [Acidimicrobiales bacterium]